MKTLIVTMLLLLMLPCGVFAQDGEETMAPAFDAEAAHNALRDLRDDAISAANNGDIDGILKHLHKDVVFTAMDGTVHRGHDAIRAYFDKMMTGDSRIVENVTFKMLVDELTIIYDEDTGIAYGSTDDSFSLTSGTAFDVQSRWSSTLVHEDGRWQVASFHSSASMFDNPLLDAATNSLMWTGIIALLVGLVIGFFGGRMTAKS